MAIEYGVEAADLMASLLDLAAYAEDISCPGLVGFVRFIESKFGLLLVVQGVGADFVGAVQADASIDAFVDGTWKHEATVVIGVFADEVDTSRRSVNTAILSKTGGESLFQFSDVHGR